jgi:hypothetical protein
MVTPVMVKVSVVVFEYGAAFERLFQVPPPSVLTCHWKLGAGAPLTVTLKFAVPPASDVAFAGWVTNVGASLTMLVKAEFPALLYAQTRYEYCSPVTTVVST